MKLTDKQFEERFWLQVDIRGECWLWTGSRSVKGYGNFQGRWQGQLHYKAHRFVWALYNGPIPAGKQVRHSCDNRWCVNPAHLRLGTNQDNVNDRNGRGRTAVGERARHAKLTEDQVREIKANPDKPPRYYADKFSIDSSAITKIRSGDNWKHVH